MFAFATIIVNLSCQSRSCPLSARAASSPEILRSNSSGELNTMRAVRPVRALFGVRDVMTIDNDEVPEPGLAKSKKSKKGS